MCGFGGAGERKREGKSEAEGDGGRVGGGGDEVSTNPLRVCRAALIGFNAWNADNITNIGIVKELERKDLAL